MQIFEFSDYKKYVKKRIESMPKRGRGQFRKLSEHLNVGSTVISQIFSGSRELTPEQAVQVCQYFALAELETRYFVHLVQKERAATVSFKKYLQLEIDKILEEARTIKARIPAFEEISEEAKARYYSDWTYATVRLLTALPGRDNLDAIAEYLQIPREKLRPTIDFLLQHGICVEKDGMLFNGPTSTHLGDDSPFINAHRRNWRAKALERVNNPQTEDLFYSLIITLSDQDRVLIKEKIIALVTETLKVATPSVPQKLLCLNFDWFEVV